MTSAHLSRRAVLASGAFLLQPARAAGGPEPIAEYERTTGGRVGLFARNAATGRELAWRADERFTMCSTFKVSLAALMLTRVDAGQEILDRRVAFGPQDLQPYAPAARANLARAAMTISEMCQAVVEVSDNTCANLLLRELGGPSELTSFWRGIGDGFSRLDHDEPMLNRSKPPDVRDTTTPRAMAHTMTRLLTGDVLLPPSRERLAAWMVACQTGLKKLRSGVPQDWRVGDKTGNNGSDAAGDLAIAWPRNGGPITISAYVQGGKPAADQQDMLFAALGQLVASSLA